MSLHWLLISGKILLCPPWALRIPFMQAFAIQTTCRSSQTLNTRDPTMYPVKSIDRYSTLIVAKYLYLCNKI